MSASDSAKSRMERVLRLHEQIDALKLDIRQVYAEEKADGGDKTAMGAAVSYIRKRDKEGSDLADREAMADVYLAAYDAPRAHTHTRENLSYSQSGLSYAEEKGRGERTDNQESDQPDEADVPATAAVASDEMAAQDDVGATASSTNSPEGAAKQREHVPSQHEVRPGSTSPGSEQQCDTLGVTAGETASVSHSQAAPHAPADTAGESVPPSSRLTSPATYLEMPDIPAFLDRRQPKAREWEDASA